MEWVGNETRVAQFIQAYKVRRILAMRSFFCAINTRTYRLNFFRINGLETSGSLENL